MGHASAVTPCRLLFTPRLSMLPPPLTREYQFTSFPRSPCRSTISTREASRYRRPQQGGGNQLIRGSLHDSGIPRRRSQPEKAVVHQLIHYSLLGSGILHRDLKPENVVFECEARQTAVEL